MVMHDVTLSSVAFELAQCKYFLPMLLKMFAATKVRQVDYEATFDDFATHAFNQFNRRTGRATGGNQVIYQ